MFSLKNSNFYIIFVSSMAALAGLLFGYDTGIVSGALIFLDKDFVISTGIKELIVSSVLLGAMCGSLFSGTLADRFGRRKLMLIISGLFILGTAIATSATNTNAILIGRIFIGLAIGMGSYTAPLYIAEVSPYNLRGSLVSLNQLMVTAGILCSYIASYVFSHGENSWRWMFGLGLMPAVMLSVGMLFLPESPRWLVKQNKIFDAVKTLKKLRRSQDVADEMNDIQTSLNVKHARFKDVFAPWVLSVLLLGIALGFVQQATGINTIIYYAPTIFQMAGFHDVSSSILATVGIGIVNVLATIFAIFYLDVLGRRPLLLSGLFGMGVALLSLSIAFNMGSNLEFMRWIAIICTFGYIICFAYSLGAIVWLLVSEIFPLEIRATAMGIAIFSGWFWNFIVSSTFLTLLDKFGASGTFFMYATICFASLIFCYYKVPETRGITLEQIERNIRKRLPLRKIGEAPLPALSTH